MIKRISILIVCIFSSNFAHAAKTPGRTELDQVVRQEFKQRPEIYREKSKELAERTIKGVPAARLSENESLALYGYTVSFYEQVNRSLRAGSAQKIAAYIAALDGALAKLPVFDGVVTRGTHLSAGVSAKYKVGAVVEDKGYVSSTKLLAAEGASLMFIKSKTGRSIAQYSAKPSESEVIFPRNSKFKVISREKNRAGVDVIEMEQVL